MEVIKAAVMGIAAAMLALYMKSVRPEYSSMISISAGHLLTYPVTLEEEENAKKDNKDNK